MVTTWNGRGEKVTTTRRGSRPIARSAPKVVPQPVVEEEEDGAEFESGEEVEEEVDETEDVVDTGEDDGTEETQAADDGTPKKLTAKDRVLRRVQHVFNLADHLAVDVGAWPSDVVEAGRALRNASIELRDACAALPADFTPPRRRGDHTPLDVDAQVKLRSNVMRLYEDVFDADDLQAPMRVIGATKAGYVPCETASGCRGRIKRGHLARS